MNVFKYCAAVLGQSDHCPKVLVGDRQPIEQNNLISIISVNEQKDRMIV